MNILRISTLALAALAAACSGQPEQSPAATDDSAPAELPTHDTSGMGEAAAPAAGLGGTVLETMDSGGYTYVLIDTGSEEVWAAGPPTKLAVGDEVQVGASMPMENFPCPSLDRTFELIHLAQSISLVGQSAAGAAMPGGHGTPKADTGAALDLTGLARPEGGQTVEEVFLMQDELVGTELAIRAKVVKFNGGIMGKNWMHLQDGTGSAGTDDLTITTDDTAAVGDTVVVRGILVADRDFGSGYSYDLIIEDAKVTVE